MSGSRLSNGILPVNVRGSRYWTDEEHKRFLEGMTRYGLKNLKRISAYVGTRTAEQVRTHAQKYMVKFERDRTRKLVHMKALQELEQRGNTSRTRNVL